MGSGSSTQNKKICGQFSCNIWFSALRVLSPQSKPSHRPFSIRPCKNSWVNTRTKATLCCIRGNVKKLRSMCSLKAILHQLHRRVSWFLPGQNAAMRGLKRLRKKRKFQSSGIFLLLIPFITLNVMNRRRSNCIKDRITVVSDLFKQGCDLLHCQLMKSCTRS